MSGILESGEWVVYGSVVVAKASVLLGCAYVASVLLRRGSAAVRHAVWAAAIVGVVALPLLGAAFPTMRVSVPLPAWPAAAETVPLTGSGWLVAEADGQASSIEAAPSSAARVVPEGGAGVRESQSSAQRNWRLPVSGSALVLGVWLAGALAVLGYTLLSILHVRFLARRAGELRDMRVLARVHGIASEQGVKWPVEVLEGDADAMPMTFGVASGTLLLPASARSWPAERLEAVLRHELAHIRRRDPLMELVAEVGCALYWFHPGVWLAARRLRVEREHACDDVVLLAGARASDYARELLDIARTMRSRPRLSHAALAMAHPSRLRSRLVAVLEDRPRAARLPGTLLAAFVTTALAVVMTLAVVSLSWASQDPLASGTVVGDTLPPVPLIAPAPPPVAPGPPLAAPSPPLAAPPAPVAPSSLRADRQDAGCWGRFTGNRVAIERDGGVHRIQTIQRTVDGVRLCMQLRGDVELDANGTTIRSIGPDGVVVLSSREANRDLYLEITPAAGGARGVEHAWYVDGERRAFDDAAAEWRDAALAVLHGAGQIASIRGEVASLRGEIASVRGRRASLRGEMASIRGREASLRGELASMRGRTASLRGEMASIRGREASMRGEIESMLGQISALESAQRRTTDQETRSRLEDELGWMGASIAEVERRIAEYDAPGRVAEVEARLRAQAAEAEAASRAMEASAAALDTDSRMAEVEARLAALDVDGEVARIQRRIEALDADARIAEVEARIPPQEERLLRSLRRIR